MYAFLLRIGWRGLGAIVILSLLFVGAVVVSNQLVPRAMTAPYGDLGAGERQVSVVVNKPGTVESIEAKFFSGEISGIPGDRIDEYLRWYLTTGISEDDHRFSLRMQGNFPAESKIDVNLTGVIRDLSEIKECHFFTGFESGEIVQSPIQINANGITIEGWKIDTMGFGFPMEKEFQPKWAEFQLERSADTVAIYCDSPDNYSASAGAAMTVNYPRLAITVEGQVRAPALTAEHTIRGPVDLRVMSGTAIDSYRPSYFKLVPEWSKSATDYGSNSNSDVEAMWLTSDPEMPLGYSRATYLVNPPDSSKLGVQVSSYWRWTEVESVSGQTKSQKMAAIGGGIFGFGLGLLAPIAAILWRSSQPPSEN